MPPALTKDCVSNPAPKLPSPHLQAGYDEVHSFFWRKDFKEAITCYQDEPGNQIKTGFKVGLEAEASTPQLKQTPSMQFYEQPCFSPKGQCRKAQRHHASPGGLALTIHGAEAVLTH